MKALLTNYHQSPQKVRLVANLVRGKSVPAARAALTFLPQKSSPAILKLLESAVANARQSGVATDELFIKTITVNKGMALRRFKPMARGRAAQFNRTMSIVALELGENPKAKKAKAAKKETPTTEESAPKTAKPRAAKPAAKKVKTVKAE
jgi:large subunit ribosomal protein L22